MSALQVTIDGFFTAAELAALLFISPALGSESPPAGALRAAPTAIERTRTPTLLSSSLDVQLFGAEAELRVTQHFRNDSGDSINLAASLPAIDESTDALRIHRGEHTINLLQIDRGCGGDPQGDAAEVLHHPAAGHAQLQVDELIADAMQLMPGEVASIEVSARMPISRSGTVHRLMLPKRTAAEPQAWLIDQRDQRFLLVIPQHAEPGTARLTLRPFYSPTAAADDAVRAAAAEVIELGPLSELSQTSDWTTAYLVPLADRAALKALQDGAIELEIQMNDRVVWSTLTARVQPDASLALARSTR